MNFAELERLIDRMTVALETTEEDLSNVEDSIAMVGNRIEVLSQQMEASLKMQEQILTLLRPVVDWKTEYQEKTDGRLQELERRVAGY